MTGVPQANDSAMHMPNVSYQVLGITVKACTLQRLDDFLAGKAPAESDSRKIQLASLCFERFPLRPVADNLQFAFAG